jgi:hypothetical protein
MWPLNCVTHHQVLGRPTESTSRYEPFNSGARRYISVLAQVAPFGSFHQGVSNLDSRYIEKSRSDHFPLLLRNMSDYRYSQSDDVRRDQQSGSARQGSSQGDRYLRPGDLYQTGTDAGYYTTSPSTSSYSGSGSRGAADRRNDPSTSSAGYGGNAYTQTLNPYQQYQPAMSERYSSSVASTYSSRRISPVEDASNRSRYGTSGGGGHRDSYTGERTTHRDSSHSPKGKSKSKDSEVANSGSRHATGDRHRDGNDGSRSGGRASGQGDKLVSGVFIRY